VTVCRKGGASQAAEKRSNAVILSPFAVILSVAKNLALPLRVNCAKDLALSIFKAMRDSSSPVAPQNDSAEGFFRRLFSPAEIAPPVLSPPLIPRLAVPPLPKGEGFLSLNFSPRPLGERGDRKAGDEGIKLGTVSSRGQCWA